MERVAFMSGGHELPLVHAKDFSQIMHNTRGFPRGHRGVQTVEGPGLFPVYRISKFAKCKILLVDSLTLV